jgi:hypothetical protein
MRRSRSLHALAAAAAAAICGCGGGGGGDPVRLPQTAPAVGPSPRYRPLSVGAAAARGLPVAGLSCARAAGPRYGAHLELFAKRRVVLIPPGIGIAPPRHQQGAYVSGGRCSYPLRTREPTGVVEVAATSPTKTLGQLFAVWGQPLGRNAMAGFRGPVRAYVGGRAWHGTPGAIPLERHAQIVLEVGGYVRPHARYRFPPGL